ncbi:MAG: hypothetical protein M3Y39_11125 [Chloroflexota bacterium]|nr:hypothetical protein [Chloroflexota bacterium]
MREPFSPEEGHERGGEGLDALIERFQRAFAADGITQQHHDKVNEIVMAEPVPGEAHTLLKRRKYAQVPKIVRNHSHFTKPRGHGGNRLWSSLDGDRCLCTPTHRVRYWINASSKAARQ